MITREPEFFPPSRNAFGNVGRSVVFAFRATGQATMLLISGIIAMRFMFTKRSRHEILVQMFVFGIKSLGVITVVAVFTGMILALQTGIALSKYNQEVNIGTAVMVSMLREMGPFMTGLILAACVGSAIAAINRKEIYRTYVGVDASMSALMRPGMYDAYHHIDVVGKDNSEVEIVDVVGSLCENNDKFAVQRELPVITNGDVLVIQDTGAHGLAMGFNYNGSLRPKELLLKADGSVELIRREENVADYFATLSFDKDTLAL